MITLQILPLAFLLPLLISFQEQPGSLAEPWKYDVIYRKKGDPISGLILEQGPQGIRIRTVARKTGRPTITFIEHLSPDEIEKVEMLSPQEREKLNQRLQALIQQRKLFIEQLNIVKNSDIPSMDLVSLKSVDWAFDPIGKALEYDSLHFRLISNAREEMVQLAAIQLEEVYAAYSRFMPSRFSKPNRTTIVLVRSIPEYQALLQKQERNFFNQGFYDINKNRIICGSDLQRLKDELERSRSYHQKTLIDLEERKKQLNIIYKGKIPAELLEPIRVIQNRIKSTEDKNLLAFASASQRLFQRLYHEAFHAYLNTSVYPSDQYQVPIWLNEGLAQIFESAIFEAGELRIGHADKERLTAVREAIEKKELLPLTELLRSNEQQFQVARTASQQISDKTYLASWALSFHLTFHRKKLGGKEMDAYAKAIKRGEDPIQAFSILVGQSIQEFEKEHQEYLAALKPDGTVRPKKQ